MLSGGRQLSCLAKRCYTLHNLILPIRRSSTEPFPSAANRLDDFTARLVEEKSQKWRAHSSLRYREYEPTSTSTASDNCVAHQGRNVKEQMSAEEEPEQANLRTNEVLGQEILTALSKNKHNDVVKLILDCEKKNETISSDVIVKLLKAYSGMGQVDKILLLQTYCKRLHSQLFLTSGEFIHLLAKAHCLKGNSDRGLKLLSEAYGKYRPLRNMYRTIIRELVQDSVCNRSEASLVVFRRHVEEWSERWRDPYPLVCFWHSCWVSAWFSDQKLADELVDHHEQLRLIIKDRASALSVTALHGRHDDDAVVRLLQTLLRHDMMPPYVTVLQTLFHYRLKNRDSRGCAEILQNCKTLGITMSSSLQGKYIHMIIDGEHTVRPMYSTPKAPLVKDFKLKF